MSVGQMAAKTTKHISYHCTQDANFFELLIWFAPRMWAHNHHWERLYFDVYK
jgi:hypothetical protein